MDLCEKRRADDDHLWQVAGIRKKQIQRLQAVGISTLADLGRADPETRVAGMAPQTLKNLHHQARLQLLKKETGQNHLEMLPVTEEEIRGFARLPNPDPGDLFFDMEGDPFEQGGLEYLFGLYFFDKGQPVFYVFPVQETKLKTGDKAALTHSGQAVSNLFVDQTAGRVTFTLSQKADSPPDQLCLGPGGPVYNQVLREAVFCFADSLIRKDEKYRAIKDLLGRKPPRMAGHSPGAPIIDEKKPALEQIIKSICGLEQSYLFIQGPPGSGKTYTGSHVIVSLLQQGYRVGVSSNSHKAICNLLHGVEKVAQKQNVSFRGVKKSTSGNDGSMLNGQIICDVFKNEEATARGNQLVAGTAWLFARPEMDQALDFLFVDEAGQVSLANLAAMATSAENLVLLGDQMQLGQPIQGIHPGRSGQSSLEYLLNGLATIPPEMGIFLKTTFRMHPDVCRLISDMVYDSRLEPEPNNINQVLILNKQAHPELLPSGVRFVEACHDGCSQKSETEAESVRQIIASLVCQKYRDRTGKTHALSLENILVVAPYNMQVNLLKSVLPAGARVGTVDKFQGQQAEVVIVSMTTSGETDLPRHIGFLYSKNRLNVALSRARSLAVLVASLDLLSINCSSPEEVALVNALCWVKEYSGRFSEITQPAH